MHANVGGVSGGIVSSPIAPGSMPMSPDRGMRRRRTERGHSCRGGVMEQSSIEASCHCGTIRLAIDGAPEEVTECNCSICRRYGVLWAYYSPKQVRFMPPEPATD